MLEDRFQHWRDNRRAGELNFWLLDLRWWSENPSGSLFLCQQIFRAGGGPQTQGTYGQFSEPCLSLRQKVHAMWHLALPARHKLYRVWFSRDQWGFFVCATWCLNALSYWAWASPLKSLIVAWYAMNFFHVLIRPGEDFYQYGVAWQPLQDVHYWTQFCSRPFQKFWLFFVS